MDPPAALAALMESRARRLAVISASRADSGESPAPTPAGTVKEAGDDMEAGAAAFRSRTAASPASKPRDMGRSAGGSDSATAWKTMAPPQPGPRAKPAEMPWQQSSPRPAREPAEGYLAPLERMPRREQSARP